MTRTYSVVLLVEPEGGYSVSVPAIPGCNTQGDTVPEALDMAREAIGALLECFVEDGEPIPEEGEVLPVRMWHTKEALISKLEIDVPGLEGG